MSSTTTLPSVTSASRSNNVEGGGGAAAARFATKMAHRMKPHDMIRALRFRLSQLETVEDVNVALAEANTRLQQEVERLRGVEESVTTDNRTLADKHQSQARQMADMTKTIISLQDQMTLASQKNATLRKLLTDTRMALHSRSAVANSAEEKQETLGQTIFKLTEQLRSINTEHQHCIDHRKLAARKLEDVRIMVKERDEKIAQQKDTIKHHSEDCHLLRRQVASLQMLLAKAEKAHESCDATIESLRTDLTSAESSRDSFETKLAKVTGDQSILKKKYAILDERCNEKIEMAKSMRSKVEEAEAELAQLKISVEVGKREKEAVEKKLTRVEQYLVVEQKRKEEAEQKSTEMVARERKLVAESTESTTEISNLQELVQKREDEVKQLSMKLDDFKGQLSQLQQVGQEKQEEHNTFEEEFAEERKRVGVLEGIVREREQKIAGLEEKIAQLERSLKVSQHKEMQMNKLAETCTKQAKHANQAYITQQEEVEKARHALHVSQSTITQLREDCERHQALGAKYEAELSVSQSSYGNLSLKYEQLMGLHAFCDTHIAQLRTQIDSMSGSIAKAVLGDDVGSGTK